METADRSVDRETLYNEVWTEPVSVVAPRYGLSDVGLAKICRSLAIPLPSRGYWAKVKAVPGVNYFGRSTSIILAGGSEA